MTKIVLKRDNIKLLAVEIGGNSPYVQIVVIR